MKKHPIWYMIIGLAFLLVPTIIYLIFLIPKLSDEYNVLIASGGVIGSSGLYLTEKIPETWHYSKIFKFASKSFTLLTVMTLVEKFYMQILGLLVVVVLSIIIFYIFKGLYSNGKQRNENERLANEVTRSVIEAIK